MNDITKYKIQNCFEYIEHLRNCGRTIAETEELLKKSDFGRLHIKAAIKKAKKYQHWIVYPKFTGLPPKIEPLM